MNWCEKLDDDWNDELKSDEEVGKWSGEEVLASIESRLKWPNNWLFNL